MQDAMAPFLLKNDGKSISGFSCFGRAWQRQSVAGAHQTSIAMLQAILTLTKNEKSESLGIKSKMANGVRSSAERLSSCFRLLPCQASYEESGVENPMKTKANGAR